MKNSRRSLISRTLEHLRNLWRRRKRAGRVTADRSQLRLEMLEPRLALTISSPLPGVPQHIHPVLSIFIDGHQVVIPAGVGLTSTTNFDPHTHDFTGTLHIGEGGPAGLGTEVRNTTLKDFFDVWRTTNVGQATNNPNAIFDTVTTDGTALPRILDKTVNPADHVLRVYVKESADSAPELEYDSSAATNDLAHPEDYVPRDGDQIIISYDKIAQAAFGPSFDTIANQTVLVGAPLWLALDGFDPNGGPITYDVQVGNPNLLEANIPQNDRSLVMDVAGFGKMTFELFDGLAPRVTQRIVDLANSGFYNLSGSNQITFHRVVPNFVIQAGDPTGTGGGGSLLGDFDDQFNVDLQHTSAGILSMAKSTDDTNDSQFFVTDTATRFLDFNHSIFGRLTEGEAIRDAINSVPVHTDQNDPATFNHPITPVVINSISVVQHDPQNAALELKAKPGATGTTTVTVTAHDAQNHTFSQTFQVTFANDTSNGAPFLQDISPVHVTSGQPIQIQLASTDIEGDPVVYSALKPAGETTAYTLNVNSSTGLVTVTPPAGFVGTFNVLAQVKSVTPNSTGTGTDFDEQKIAVTVSAAGPSAVDLVSTSDTGISNTDNITNAASLDFLVTGITSGATVKLFKDSTLLAQGTANGTSITLTVANPGTLLGQGISHITATQTPAGGQESAASPVLDITFDNLIADFTSVGPSSALDGFDINYNAQNPDEGSAGFSYSLTTPPAGGTINSSTGVLTWIPTAAQIGPQSFAIVATDTAGNTRTQSLNVTVNDSKVDLTFTITKPDGTPLTSLSLNQDFVLHVFTRDLRTPARGVFAGYLDVLWDSTKAIVTAADLAHPLTYGTNYQSGQAGDASTPGLINEGGAFAGFNELGAGNRELFSVPMRATASGPLVFTAEPADDQSAHRVLVYNSPNDSSGVQVPPQEVHYSALSITVAATFNAVGDAVNALEDSQNNSFNPLANDTNIGNATNTLTITAVSTPDHGGTVVIAPNGKTISYTPSHNFAGTETFTYTAKNQNNESNSATITVTVADVNDPPTAVGDTVNVTRNSSGNAANVLANDLITPDANETLRVTAVGATSHGTVSIGANGANVLYTPSANFSGQDSFTYTISDRTSGGLTSQATVTVNVSGLAANNDATTVVEDSSNNAISPLTNDTLDTQFGGTLSISGVGTPNHGGTVTITGGGTGLNYTPSANFQGTETMTYTLSDGLGHTATGTVTATVTNTNDPPTAVNDTLTGFKNTGLTFDVLANDTSAPDPAENLVIDSITQPANGTLSIVENGKKVSFVPSSNFTGTTSFTYVVRDPSNATSNTATATISVQEFVPSVLSGFVYFDVDNDGVKDSAELPISGVTVTLTGTTTTTATVSLTVKTKNDGSYKFENLAPGTYTVKETQPAFTIDGKDTAGSQGGSTSTNDQIVVTNMPQGTTGTSNNFGERGRVVSTMSIRDLFSSVSRDYALTALDTSGGELWHSMSNPAWQGYTDGTFSLQNSTQLTLQTTNPQSQPVATTISLPSTKVGVLGQTSGNSLYRLNGGPANFSFTNTTPPNQAPTAVNDSFTATEDVQRTVTSNGVLSNDSDPDGNSLTASLAAQAVHGTVTLGSNGLFTYAPSANFVGTDSFTYRASDATTSSGLATVTITVIPVNDVPTATGDSFAATEDTPRTVAVPGVLSNDGDSDGTTPTAVNVTQPAHGTVTLGSDGSFTYTPSQNFNGTDSFTYQASDGTTQSSVATVTLNVVAVNDAPIAGNDAFTASQDVPRTVSAAGVLNNDSDPDGTTPTAVNATQPASGTVELGSDGSFTYTPSAGFSGQDSFTYQASDGTATSDFATVTINVTPANQAPVAENDEYETDEDITLVKSDVDGVLHNDHDSDSTTLTVSLVTGPTNGSLTLAPDGSFTYIPNSNFNGTDGFSYLVSDGLSESQVAAVTIIVHPVNDAPTVVGDAFTTNEDVPLTVTADGVLDNDADVDGTSPILADVTQPVHGTVTFGGDGAFTYTPSLNFNGQDSFTYQATDGTATSAVATVTITVHAVNDTPEAVGDTFAGTEDTPLTVAAPGVLANDNDVNVDDDTLLIVDVTQPGHGTVTASGTGGFTYTPEGDFNGSDSFTYRTSDGFATSGVATVTINVAPTNDAPVAHNDQYSTPVNQALIVGLPGVLENDEDPDEDVLTASIAIGPAHGSLAMGTNGSFIYTPAAFFHGIDSFSYVAKDSALASTATVSIAVNSAPTAIADDFETSEDIPLTIAASGVLTNDSDPNSDGIFAELVSGAQHGSVLLGTDGSFTYTPTPEFNGTDGFSYWAKDVFGTPSLPVTVVLAVHAINDAPVAVGDAYTTDEDQPLDKDFAAGVLHNDTDIETPNTLTAILGQGPVHGDLSFSQDGSFHYTPSANFHGTDSFTYHNSDGVTDSADATVTITVSSVNDDPQAVGDAFDTNEDATLTVAAPGLLINDQDVDDDGLTASLAVGPGHGSLAVGADGSFTYTPSAGFDGTDSFSYTVNDGTANSAPAIVTLTVHPVNHAPIAVDDNYMATQDASLDVTVTAGVLSNDSDPDGPVTLHATVVDAPLHGSLTLGDDGHFLYTPTAGYSGPDSFTYDVSDGALHDQALVSITVQPTGGGEGESSNSDAALLAYLMSGDANHENTFALLTGTSDNWAAAVDQTLTELYA